MMSVHPKMYAENNRIVTVMLQNCMEKYNHVIKWRNNPSIMEIGHGDGGTSQRSFFPYLPSNFKEFVASDISPSMVEYARKSAILPSMKFEQLDIATEEVPSKFLGRFDHIFGFFVMHMVKNPRQGFVNMHKMLKPGGSIFLTILEHTTIDDTMDELSKHPEWSKYGVKSLISPYFYSSNPRQEWEQDLNDTGFNNHDFFEEKGSFDFLGAKEFDGILDEILHYLKLKIQNVSYCKKDCCLFLDESVKEPGEQYCVATFTNMRSGTLEKDCLLSLCIFLPNIPEDKLEEFKSMYRKLTRTGKCISTQVRDGKEIFSYNCKMFITSAIRN